MNFSPLFLAVGISFFTLMSSYAEEPSYEPIAIESLELDNDLALFEDDQSKWENDILVLEEELKEDAKSVELQTSPEAIALSPAETSIEPTIQSVVNPELQITEAPLSTIIEPSSAPIAAPEPLSESTSSEPDFLSKSPPEAPVVPQVTSPLQVMEEPPATLEVVEFSKMTSAMQVDLDQAFSGSPVIYSILMAMSTFAVCLWLYSLFSLRQEASISTMFLKNLRNKLNSNHFDDALSLCLHHENLFGKMIASGIHTRKHGLSVILESMSAEGKRASTHFWQRISLLNDIAVVAPMLGLLGTVLGMFYAFYDLNRSIESISTLFDGLGISVGTTVAGLIVAILALILHSIAKYRLVQVLTHVEREAQAFVTLIDENKPEYRG